MHAQHTITAYPLSSYTFGTKDKKVEKDSTVESRVARLKANYEQHGMRRTVEGILMVSEHNHPHVLLLQVGQNFFKLPGGRLRPGEDEVEGLKRKLTSYLSPTNPLLQTPWDIGELGGCYHRPSFDTIFYPYCPAHMTRPKEVKKLYLVHMPDKAMFAVPRNMKLVAVPLYELYDNMTKYGPVISSLPLLISRFRLNLMGHQQMPGAAVALPGPPPLPAAAAPAPAAAGQQQVKAEE